MKENEVNVMFPQAKFDITHTHTNTLTNADEANELLSLIEE